MNTNQNAAEVFTATAAQIARNLMAETGCTAERAARVAGEWLFAKMVAERPTLAAKVAAGVA